MRTRIIGILSTEHTEDTDHRNLNGIYTDGLGLPVGKKSLEEIFFKNGLWPEIIYHSAFINIIFNYNP